MTAPDAARQLPEHAPEVDALLGPELLHHCLTAPPASTCPDCDSPIGTDQVASLVVHVGEVGGSETTTAEDDEDEFVTALHHRRCRPSQVRRHSRDDFAPLRGSGDALPATMGVEVDPHGRPLVVVRVPAGPVHQQVGTDEPRSLVLSQQLARGLHRVLAPGVVVPGTAVDGWLLQIGLPERGDHLALLLFWEDQLVAEVPVVRFSRQWPVAWAEHEGLVLLLVTTATRGQESWHGTCSRAVGRGQVVGGWVATQLGRALPAM